MQVHCPDGPSCIKNMASTSLKTRLWLNRLCHAFSRWTSTHKGTCFSQDEAHTAPMDLYAYRTCFSQKQTFETSLDTTTKTPPDPKALPDIVLETSPDTAPEAPLDTIPRTSLNTAPEMSLYTAPETSLDSAPGSLLDTAPGKLLDTAPEVSPNTVSRALLNTAPETSLYLAPKTSLDIAPESLLETAPQIFRTAVKQLHE